MVEPRLLLSTTRHSKQPPPWLDPFADSSGRATPTETPRVRLPVRMIDGVGCPGEAERHRKRP